MWPQDNSTMSGSSTWRVPSEQLPLVIAILCGGTLIILLVAAAVLWRFCVAPHRNKDYRVKMNESTISRQQGPVVPVMPSHSAVFLDPKSGQWTVSSRIVDNGGSSHWFYNNHLLNPASLEACTSVPRSASVPTRQQNELKRPPRPHSQPSSISPVPKRLAISTLEGPCSLPQISEFNPHLNLCASSSKCSNEIYLSPFGGCAMLKTQSLPACVRNKSRPLSTADDISELYAKVNFSKKRKNRMRNDEAAIIALSKSRSQFLHKDTDSLVDNEAVVVYDERTAL